MTEVQKPCVERIKEFWQEILPAVHYEAWSDDLFLATMSVYVSRAIHLLIQGDVHGARQELWTSQHLLVCSKTAAEEPEISYQALHILDIGWFAWSLAAYPRFAWALAGNARCFCDILEMAKGIWHARGILGPHLSDALRAANIFIQCHQYMPPWRAFRNALKSTSFMYEVGGYFIVHGPKPIGHPLGTPALSRLKEIFRAYVRERKGIAGHRS
jgi:hypothetical protein